MRPEAIGGSMSTLRRPTVVGAYPPDAARVDRDVSLGLNRVERVAKLSGIGS